MQSTRKSQRSWFLKALAASALLAVAAGPAVSGQVGVSVVVTVQLLTTSGPCSSAGGSGAVTVSCSTGAAAPVSRSIPVLASTIGTGRFMPDRGLLAGLELYSQGGPYLSSWREVQLDNARYVELTLSW